MAQQKEGKAGLAVGLAEGLELGFAVRQLRRSGPCPDKLPQTPSRQAVGQTQSLAQRGLENRLVGLGLKSVPARLNTDLKTHALSADVLIR
jgi:hypothetical protein